MWRRVTEQNSGREYYYNISTRETRWDPPEGVQILPERPDLAAVRAHAVRRMSSLEAIRDSIRKRHSVATAVSGAAEDTTPAAGDDAATEGASTRSPDPSDFVAEDVLDAEDEQEVAGAEEAGEAEEEGRTLPPWSVISGNVSPLSPQFLFREEDYEISIDPVTGARTFRRLAPADGSKPAAHGKKKRGGWLWATRWAAAGSAPGTGGGAGDSAADEEDEEDAGPDTAVSWSTLSGNRPVISMQYHRPQGAKMIWGMPSASSGFAAKSRRPSLTPAESMREARREPPDLTQLRVLVGTWNVGNKMPSEDLSEWVPAGGGGHDIIVVGAQECTYAVKEVAPGAGEEGEDDEDEDEEEEEESEQAAVHFYRRVCVPPEPRVLRGSPPKPRLHPFVICPRRSSGTSAVTTWRFASDG